MLESTKDNPYIIFFAHDHSYWKGGRKIPSVNGILEQIKPEYDRNYWLSHKVLGGKYGQEYSKHYGSFRSPKPKPDPLFSPFLSRIDPREYIDLLGKKVDEWGYKTVLAQWRGTNFHKKMEDKARAAGVLFNLHRDKYFPVQTFEKIYDNQSICENMYELPDGAYLELLIHDPKEALVGQADIVFIETIGEKRFFDLDDYKTNEKIPDTKSREYYLEPLSTLKRSKHMDYVLQMNLYAKMLAGHGFIPRNLGYTWYESYDETKFTSRHFTYMPEEMDLLYTFLLS